MFQLLAILAFFILGLAFFAFGKDDFGIKRIKEDSSDSATKDKVIESQKVEMSDKSTQEIEKINNENESDLKATTKVSD